MNKRPATSGNGTKRTCRTNLTTSVDEGRAEVGGSRSNRRDDPTLTFETSTKLSLIYLRLGLCDSDASERGDLPDVSDGRAAARGLGQQVASHLRRRRPARAPGLYSRWP